MELKVVVQPSNSGAGKTLHENIQVVDIGLDGYVGDCPLRYVHCTNDGEYEEGMEYAYEYLCGYPGSRYANNCDFPCPLKKQSVLIRFVEE